MRHKVGYAMGDLGGCMTFALMGSMLSAMADDDEERASLSSARGFGSMIGNIIPLMIMPQLLSAYGDTAAAFRIGSIVCAGIGFVFCLLHYFWTEERNVSDAPSEESESVKFTDIIIVPVGTVEMHGGFPLDSETVISEAFALRMAEACDGLVLTGLPYFYAGATASDRGTVQVSVRQGIDYLGAVARSLLRQGFKRQVHLSFHGPAHMTVSPMVQDFFDETGVPILYMDLALQMLGSCRDLLTSMDSFHAITVGAYQIMGRLEDVPLTTAFQHSEPQTCAPFNDLFSLAYQSASVGYCFADPKDHMSTTAIPNEAVRQQLADEGQAILEEWVRRMDMPHVVAQLRNLNAYTDEVAEGHPWMPSAWNNRTN